MPFVYETFGLCTHAGCALWSAPVSNLFLGMDEGSLERSGWGGLKGKDEGAIYGGMDMTGKGVTVVSGSRWRASLCLSFLVTSTGNWRGL